MRNNLFRYQNKKYICLAVDGCSSLPVAIANHPQVLVYTTQSHDPGYLISF
jgi:hypothetical protein